MRWIKKSSPPNSLQEYNKAKNGKDIVHFGSVEEKVSKPVKEALLSEQDYLCAYCQQEIHIRNMKVEHHCEFSICNGSNGTKDRRLDYTNLLAVCNGKGNKETHCDTKKAELATEIANKRNSLKKELLPMDLNPTIQSHTKAIVYTSTGLIETNNETRQIEIEQILNLNCDTLKKLRNSRWNNIFFRANPKRKKKQPVKPNLDKVNRLLKLEIDRNSSFKGMYEFMLKKFT
jgi:uncharacterized protein (TIGR02646 family)